MEPTPSPTPSTPAPGQMLVEYVRTNRQNVATGLLALSVVFLALTGWIVLKATRTTPSVDPDKEKKADEKKSDLDPFNPELTPAKVSDPNRGDYVVGGIGAGMLFLITGAGGTWLMARPPAPTEAAQRTEIRALLLAVGGLAGMLLIAMGGWYFYRWSGSLSDWLDKAETKQARWVLIPLLLIAFGAGLAFVTAQPARAEERNNSTIRKLVYGTNLGLSVLLLFVALVIANIALGRRLPNKLDTTESGFYSLSNGTKEFLGRLDQPVTAYAILPEGGSRTIDDVRRLLRSCEDVPGGQFKVKFISPTLNKAEYRTLSGKYPVLEVNELGVLLTIGTDEKRHSFIREDEFSQRDPNTPRGGQPSISFVGESRLMRELQFLTENQNKAVVYFTQSAGELDLEGTRDEETMSFGAATRLKAFLERNFLEVKPLKFDSVAPKVPDDATVVVVAEPRGPFSTAMAAALQQYVTQPRAENKKGKLIVLSSARFGPDGKIVKTGLDGVLAGFNVRLHDRMIFGEETRELGPTTSFVVFAPPAIKARNPVAVALGEKVGFVTSNWRPVTTANAQPGGPFRILPLLVTQPGRPTWLEDERVTDLSRVMRELNELREVRIAKQLTENSRPVALVVSEGEVGRLAVFGNGMMFSDEMARQAQGADPITFDLMSATIDWLRDRPTLGVGVEAKKYKEFTFPIGSDETRALWLPLALTGLLVGGAGAGVWVIRRK